MILFEAEPSETRVDANKVGFVEIPRGKSRFLCFLQASPLVFDSSALATIENWLIMLLLCSPFDQCFAKVGFWISS